MRFLLEIKPAIPPGGRHKIEAVLEELGGIMWQAGGLIQICHLVTFHLRRIFGETIKVEVE